MKLLTLITVPAALLSGLYCEIASAVESAAPAMQTAIPFKADKGAMAGSGISIFVFLLLFVGIGLLLYYLKKQSILKIGAVYNEDAIKIIGIKRLSTKTTAFVINANGAEVLIVQTNDKTSLLQLDSKKES